MLKFKTLKNSYTKLKENYNRVITGEEGCIIAVHGSLYTIETNETGRVENYDKSELEKLF